MSDKPRMLWVARDQYPVSILSIHVTRPVLNGSCLWESVGKQYALYAPGMFDDLQTGECRMFVEFAPRVVHGGVHGESLRWGKNGWVRVPYAMPGDIILPMPPDPTPYMAQADPNAARREEIRAQIAELQAELDGMDG